MSDLKQKPFDIPKRLVWEAYRKVAANKGAAGVDGQSISEFEEDLKGNLYKLWNRLSSGTYFPPPVRGVEIPKKAGRNQNARSSDGDRPDGADSGLHGAGADSGAGISPGFLRVPAWAVGAACGGKGSSAVLGKRLGSAGINRPGEGT